MNTNTMSSFVLICLIYGNLQEWCELMNFRCWQCKRLVLQYIPLILVNGEKFLEKNDVCALVQACDASQKRAVGSLLEAGLLSDA
jgi:saposin